MPNKTEKYRLDFGKVLSLDRYLSSRKKELEIFITGDFKLQVNPARIPIAEVNLEGIMYLTFWDSQPYFWWYLQSGAANHLTLRFMTSRKRNETQCSYFLICSENIEIVKSSAMQQSALGFHWTINIYTCMTYCFFALEFLSFSSKAEWKQELHTQVKQSDRINKETI